MSRIVRAKPDDSPDLRAFACSFGPILSVMKRFKNRAAAADVLLDIKQLGTSIKVFKNWRKDASAAVVFHRVQLCCRLLVNHATGAGRAGVLDAVADGIVYAHPMMRKHMYAILCRYDIAPEMCYHKTSRGDVCWVVDAYHEVHQLRHHLFRESVRAKRSDAVCRMISAFSYDTTPPVLGQNERAFEIFHALDCDSVVGAVKKAGAMLSWVDAASNHRTREKAIKADPRIPPLTPSFYEMVFDRKTCVARSFDRHHDVMNTLDIMVEMHESGRVGRDVVDAARDHLFSMAGSPAYRYLLSESHSNIASKLAAVVVPMAMTAARSAAQGDKTQ